MKILFFGDVFGRPGREAVSKILPMWQKKYQPDFVGMNAENLAHGKGATSKTLKEMMDLGFDFFTGGNHIFENQEAAEILANENFPIVRPFNCINNCLGRGWRNIKKNDKQLVVACLMGQVFINNVENISNPFFAAQDFLSEIQQAGLGKAATFLDFHAEATSEKVGMSHFLDGKVSALVGTHTHVQTADEGVSPLGTAYISDVGMCGIKNSVIGLDTEVALNRFLNKEENLGFKIAEDGEARVNAVLIEVDENDAKSKKITRLQENVSF
ncbi:MAG: TIGR00282 family metallophosphoesterase [Patescibacteria group bacterium]